MRWQSTHLALCAPWLVRPFFCKRSPPQCGQAWITVVESIHQPPRGSVEINSQSVTTYLTYDRVNGTDSVNNQGALPFVRASDDYGRTRVAAASLRALSELYEGGEGEPVP